MIRFRIWRIILLLCVTSILFITYRKFFNSGLSSSPAPKPSEKSESSSNLGTLPSEYIELLKLDLNSFRKGFPPQDITSHNDSQVEDDKVFFDRDGRPIPWYTDFPHWNLLQRIRERGWEMASRAGLRSPGMGSGHVGGSSFRKTEVYTDVTGFVKGSWTRESNYLFEMMSKSSVKEKPKPIKDDSKHISEVKSWGRNLKIDKGNVRIWFMEDGEIGSEYANVRVRNVKAQFDIESADGEVDWRVVLHGLHSADTGAMVLTSSSYKFPGILALPHLALTEQHFQAFRRHLNNTILTNLPNDPHYPINSPLKPDPEDIDLPLCELVVYLQQYPLDHISIQTFTTEEIEREIRRPFGLMNVHAPDIKMSMLAFSPDCGYVLESDGPPLLMPKQADHLVGLKNDVFLTRASRHILGFSLILLLHLFFLRRQIKDADTPSMKNRISSWTLYITTLLEGMVVYGSLIFGTATESLFKAFVVLSVVAGMSFIVGVAFLADVSAVQFEDAVRERRQEGAMLQNNTIPLTAQNPVDTSQLVPGNNINYVDSGSVLILTADQANFISAATESGNNTPSRGMVLRRTVFVAAAIFIVSFYASYRSADHGTFSHNWRRPNRELYLFFLLLMNVSIWIPQIFRNVVRNCRKALRWDFIFGESIIRLSPVAYVYIYSGNVVGYEFQPRVFFGLTGWMFAQVFILILQAAFGPRWGIPRHWLPPAYDYHPVLREDDETTRVISGFTESSSKSEGPSLKGTVTMRDRRQGDIKEDRYRRVFDCAICMQAVQVPIMPVSSYRSAEMEGEERRGKGTAFLWRLRYMITPCRHVFHTKCLEAAMRYRLQCPICREGLPAL